MRGECASAPSDTIIQFFVYSRRVTSSPFCFEQKMMVGGESCEGNSIDSVRGTGSTER